LGGRVERPVHGVSPHGTETAMFETVSSEKRAPAVVGRAVATDDRDGLHQAVVAIPVTTGSAKDSMQHACVSNVIKIALKCPSKLLTV